MSPRKKWITIAVSVFAGVLICIFATLFALNFAVDLLFSTFLSKAVPPLQTIAQIESIIGLKLPHGTQILKSEAAYDNGVLFETWILKSPATPFTLQSVSSFPNFQLRPNIKVIEVTPGNSEIQSLQHWLGKKLPSPVFTFRERWENADWTINATTIQSGSDHYTELSAHSMKQLPANSSAGSPIVTPKPQHLWPTPMPSGPATAPAPTNSNH
jgi:hypothetical protein